MEYQENISLVMCSGQQLGEVGKMEGSTPFFFKLGKVMANMKDFLLNACLGYLLKLLSKVLMMVLDLEQMVVQDLEIMI